MSALGLPRSRPPALQLVQNATRLELEIVGAYEIHVTTPLGRGGMGEVLFGFKRGELGFLRRVAAKRLRPRSDGSSRDLRILADEARLMARVAHTNVVSMIDLVRSTRDSSSVFAIMDYIQGESTATLVDSLCAAGRRMPQDIACAIVVDVLHGLHAAHEVGIVHRDVSPDNILLGRDGVGRVIDFGIAKAAGKHYQTATGVVRGKLPYLSPEQFSSLSDRRTDVYGAAVSLWEMLTSRTLFSGSNEASIVAAVLKGACVPPSHYAGDVSPALDQLVMCALARDPQRRFATTEAMADAIVRAVPIATRSRVRSFLQAVAGRRLSELALKLDCLEDVARSTPPVGVDEDDVTTRFHRV